MYTKFYKKALRLEPQKTLEPFFLTIRMRRMTTGGNMKIGIMAVLLLSALALPAASGAVDLGGESRTYLRYSESMDNKKLVPVGQYTPGVKDVAMFNIE